jgi:serine/threonine protein kinase
MSAPRIGDHELAPVGKSGAKTTAGERFGAAVASPLGVLIVIPGLVAALGLFLTMLGQRALRDTSEETGRDRFSEQTGFVARSIAAALGNADPILDRMQELVAARQANDPPGPFAHTLRDLIRGRPGMSYASVSYPDGRFQGSFLDADGVIRFQECAVTKDGGTIKRFDFKGTDELVLKEQGPYDYDPRNRSFYRIAVDAKHRVWTKPYPFFDNHYTGVTRVEPLYQANGSLLAVLTADFDVHALSASIERAPLPGAKTLLYTKDGTVLAYPEGAEAILRLPLRLDKALTYRDLGDPVISQFFERVVTTQPKNGEFVEFSAANDAELAMVTDVPRFPELGWSAAAIIPEAVFFSGRSAHEKQSLTVAAIAVLLSFGIGIVFARHVVKVRRDMARAEDIAEAATARAKDLGSYRLVERLGAGGMGEVWRAEHRLLARQAAIKVIRKDALANAMLPPQELRERFRIEAQTLAMLRSRHTIELFDYGVTEEGTFFFVMELLDGIDLETLIDRFGAQPVGRVIELLIQACRSLGEAHAAGLVHRDVKPANLFVCRAADEVDVVKVLDFGLVHTKAPEPALRGSTPGPDAAPPGGEDATSARLTQAGQYMGTPAFMAPEQGLGQFLDGRADLYALGCTAVWLLSGKMLFDRSTGLAIMMAHLAEPIPDLRAMIPGFFPEALERVIVKCLAKSRDDRPADAQALADSLAAIELPEAEAWTHARARAWWAEHLAAKSTVAHLAPPDAVTVQRRD